MKKRKALTLIIVSATIVLSGCGGGGSASPPSGIITVPPPAPPPPPPPTTAVKFVASIGGPAIGRFYFDLNKSGAFDSSEPDTTSNRIGEFGNGVTDRLGTTTNNVPSTASESIVGYVLDISSGLEYNRITTPVGGTVLSPITTLIDIQENQDVIRSALGLTSGSTALNPGTNLLTFESGQRLTSSDPAIAADAARITSINLELLGVAALISSAGQAVPGAGRIDVLTAMGALSTSILQRGNGRLDDPAVILDTLRRAGPPAFTSAPADIQQAVADAIANYAAAIPDRVSNFEDSARIQRALRFYILPELVDLIFRRGTVERNRVAAITPSAIQAAFIFFGNAPSVPPTGTFFPLADYYSLPANRRLDLVGCSDSILRSPACNDSIFLNGLGTEQDATIVSISLDGINATKMSVTMDSNGRILIDPVNTFTGIAFFDYLARSRDGQTAMSRVYVRVEPDYSVIIP